MDISVVVPVLIKTDKHLSMTLKCLDNARKKTKLKFDLIIVETNSQYLIDLADVYIYEKYISTPEVSHNRGFKVAKGDFICLLTNDVMVNDDWLECLVDCFKINDCGLSTLGCNYFNHKKEDKIIEDRWFDVAMIKKEIFDKIGYYDERFIGSWPDTDLLIRAYKEGYKMYRNFNCIVDIESTQTTVGLNSSHQENYIRGQRLFQEKHKTCGLPIYDLVK